MLDTMYIVVTGVFSLFLILFIIRYYKPNFGKILFYILAAFIPTAILASFIFFMQYGIALMSGLMWAAIFLYVITDKNLSNKTALYIGLFVMFLGIGSTFWFIDQVKVNLYWAAVEYLEDQDYFNAYMNFKKFITNKPNHRLAAQAEEEIENLIPILASSTDQKVMIIRDFAQSFCKNQSINIPEYIGDPELEPDGVWICGYRRDRNYAQLAADTPADLGYIVLVHETEADTVHVRTCGPYVGGGETSYIELYGMRTTVVLYSLEDNIAIAQETMFAEPDCPNREYFYEDQEIKDLTLGAPAVQIAEWVQTVLP